MADKLSFGDVARLALEAGWKNEKQIDAQIAVAIVFAESGGNPQATNFRGKDQSYGLWQINMKGVQGPEKRAKYGLKSNEELLNARTNARVAYGHYVGRGKKFTDWSTYNNFTFRIYYAGATFGVREAMNKPIQYDNPSIVGGLQDTATGVAGAATDIAGALGNLGDVLKFFTERENWFRAAAVLGGALLMVMAGFMIVSDTVVGQVLKRVGAKQAVKAVKKL